MATNILYRRKSSLFSSEILSILKEIAIQSRKLMRF